MAACQVDIIGTSGSVIINYKLGSSQNTLTSNYGDTIWIDDTATDTTYTTLSGNATPSSGCLTFTNQPITYYQVDWGGLFTSASSSLKFNSIIYGSETIVISDVMFMSKNGYTALANSIISLNDSRFVPTSGLLTTSGSNIIFKLVIKCIGSDDFKLKIFDSTNNLTYYLEGVVSTEIPTGFTPIQNCSFIYA